MALKLGSSTVGSLYLGSSKVSEMYLGSHKVYESVDPYNPLGLPDFTIRLRYEDGVTPTFSKGTGTQVSSSPNVWDLFCNTTNSRYHVYDWANLLYGHTQLLEVLGANASRIGYVNRMFSGCTSLTTVALFDISVVGQGPVKELKQLFLNCTALTASPLFNTAGITSMEQMFASCTSLTSVPLLDTSSVTSMKNMFAGCKAVESGALALYTQASTQATPPTTHSGAFDNCGIDTVTGAAELAQIPTSWGGTMA